MLTILVCEMWNSIVPYVIPKCPVEEILKWNSMLISWSYCPKIAIFVDIMRLFRLFFRRINQIWKTFWKFDNQNHIAALNLCIWDLLMTLTFVWPFFTNIPVSRKLLQNQNGGVYFYFNWSSFALLNALCQEQFITCDFALHCLWHIVCFLLSQHIGDCIQHIAMADFPWFAVSEQGALEKYFQNSKMFAWIVVRYLDRNASWCVHFTLWLSNIILNEIRRHTEN